MMQPSLVSSRTPSKNLAYELFVQFWSFMSFQDGVRKRCLEKRQLQQNRITIQQFVDLESLYGSSDSLFRHRMQILQPWVNFNAYES